MIISKDEFLQWRLQPITQIFFDQIKSDLEGVKEILSRSAGINPTEDNYYRGLCKALYEILDLTPENLFVEET